MNPPADADGGADEVLEHQRQESLLIADALQKAIFNSANFSSIATDGACKGVECGAGNADCTGF